MVEYNNMPSFYLACKITEREKIRQVAAALEKEGHTITAKWWDFEQKSPEERSLEESVQVGLAEINGIRNSDMLICFITDPAYPYKGTLCEVGVALGAGVPVVVVVPKDADARSHQALKVPHLYCAQMWIRLENEDWVQTVYREILQKK